MTIIHKKGVHDAHPSLRYFVQFMCAGGWDVTKLKEKEMQVSNHTLTLWMLRTTWKFGVVFT